MAATIFGGVVVLAACGTAVTKPPPTAGPTNLHTVRVTIHLRSRRPRVTGFVWTELNGAGRGRAWVAVRAFGAPKGAIVKLYAQRFPYATSPTAIASRRVTRTGRLDRVRFTVHPDIAMRYFAQVVRPKASRKILGTSRTRYVYVEEGFAASPPPQLCARPVCHQAYKLLLTVPATAVTTEAVKHWYSYLGVSLGNDGHPAPELEHLWPNRHVHLTKPRRVGVDKFEIDANMSFRVGEQLFRFYLEVCARDSESADGVGLPGHHGCGNPSVTYDAPYIG